MSSSSTVLERHSSGARATARPNLILAICCMSLLLVGMDVTIVNVALPAIQRDLHATVSDLQWTVDAYTIVVASLLMLSGATSDRLGRRRIFQVGLVLFTGGSVLCSLAPSIHGLIAFRAVQGLGASMLNPIALSIIANAFPEPKSRAHAVGVWGAVAGVSLALGPIIGGLLTQTVGWRAIFWINLPVGIAALILTALFVPESKAQKPRSFDPVGQFLIFAALASVTYAVIEGPREGWQASMILVLFAVAVAAMLLFLWHEKRIREPLVDLRFFRSVPFSSATALALLAFACFSGFLFLSSLYLEQVRHLPAFKTGLCLLPLAVAMMLCAPISGKLVGSFGPRPAVLGAGIAFVASTVLLAQSTNQTPLPVMIVAYALFGAALGLVNPAISNTAVSGMPLGQAGVAAAIASTGRQVGAALGVAISGTVVDTTHSQVLNFTQATHPIWWGMAGCGALTLGLGWISGGEWARKSSENVAHLLEEK